MKNILSCTFIVSFTIIGGFAFQGCDNESDNILEENAYQDYLDFNVYSNTEWTPTKLEIWNEAVQRVGQNVSFDGKQFSLSLSVNELNMSERLFKIVYNGLSVNEDIAIPMMKTRSEAQHSTGYGYHIMTVSLSHSETIEFMHAIQTTTTIEGFMASVATTTLGAATSIIVAGYFTFQSLNWGYVESRYLNSNSRGSTLRMVRTAVNGTAYWSTSYSFSY